MFFSVRETVGKTENMPCTGDVESVLSMDVPEAALMRIGAFNLHAHLWHAIRYCMMEHCLNHMYAQIYEYVFTQL